MWSTNYERTLGLVPTTSTMFSTARATLLLQLPLQEWAVNMILIGPPGTDVRYIHEQSSDPWSMWSVCSGCFLTGMSKEKLNACFFFKVHVCGWNNISAGRQNSGSRQQDAVQCFVHWDSSPIMGLMLDKVVFFTSNVFYSVSSTRSYDFIQCSFALQAVLWWAHVVVGNHSVWWLSSMFYKGILHCLTWAPESHTQTIILRFVYGNDIKSCRGSSWNYGMDTRERRFELDTERRAGIVMEYKITFDHRNNIIMATFNTIIITSTHVTTYGKNSNETHKTLHFTPYHLEIHNHIQPW